MVNVPAPPKVRVKRVVETTKVPLASVLVIFLAPVLHPKLPPPETVIVRPFKSIVEVAFVEFKVNPLVPVTIILVPVAIFKVPVN